MAHTRVLNTTIPLDGTKEAFLAKRIRETKEDIEQRMSICHAWADSVDSDGEHNLITLREQSTISTPLSGRGKLYTRYSSKGAKASLFYKDKDGNEYCLAEPSSFRGVYNSSQPVNTGEVPLLVNTIVDAYGEYAFSSRLFTAKTAGYYLAVPWINVNTSGIFYLSIRKNGVKYIESISLSYDKIMIIPIVIYLSVGDSLALYAKSEYTGASVTKCRWLITQ